MTAASIERSRPGTVSSAGSIFGLGVLSLINFVNYLDRYIVAGVVPLIEADLRIDHGQAGILLSIFMFVYMLTSPIGGYLGDRIPRRFLVAGGVFIWSLATVGSGLARTFGALLLARAIVGIGEAGYGTVAPAVISDLFPRSMRTRMLAFFYVALPVGAAAGYGIGGWVGKNYSWHTAFFVGGGPGLVLALLALLMPEPRRGATEDFESAAKIPFKEGFGQLIRNKMFWIVTSGLTLMTFSIGGLANWMPTFLNLERGMSLDYAGVVFGGITAVAGMLGTFAGGVLGDLADRRHPNGGIWVSGVGLVLAAPIMLAVARAQAPILIFGLTFVAQLFIFLNTGPLNAAIVNCVPPAFRAFAMGLNVLLLHALGDALSPTVIGALGKRFNLGVAIQLNALPVLAGGLVLLIGAMRLANRGRAS